MAEAEPRPSRYPGVTRHKRRGKFQVMFWDTATRKQVYLGYYDDEGGAARAHDLAALKYYGTGQDTKLNFSISDYEKEIKIMETMSKDEFVAYIKRQSNYFRKGTSSYRGVTRVEGDKWLARICKAGNCINLGWFETEEEAAQAYDIAAIELFGPCAYINIDNTNSSEDGLKKPKGPSDLSELEGAGLVWKGERRTSTRIRSRPLRDWIGERFIYGRIYDCLVASSAMH
ncbi:hypothetical protein ACP4OV_029362 [Aristida adscensionis]